MTSPTRNNLFLSQRIVQQGTNSPPLLSIPVPSNHTYKTENNNKHREGSSTSVKASSNDSDQAMAWEWKLKIDIKMIPSLSMYYMLEPTSVTLKDIPIPVVESRMSEFLRIQSISYSFDSDLVRLDCITSNMLKFVVQMWRVGGGYHNQENVNPNRAITLELQRRQGSVLEMHSIRRQMFRALLTGEQPAAPTSGRDSKKPTIPDTIMAELDAHYDHREGLTEAIEICLRLLESQCFDQSRLGLESLRMLTDPSVVSHQDAVLVSRAVVLNEGEHAARLQRALADFFGVVVSYQRGEDYEDINGHNMGLAILANALQLVTEDLADGNNNPSASTFDQATDFWTSVREDLFYNVERAVNKPNEGAISAKCLRLLASVASSFPAALQAPTRGHVGLRTCLAQAHKFGQHCHLSLERESQQLLAMDTVF